MAPSAAAWEAGSHFINEGFGLEKFRNLPDMEISGIYLCNLLFSLALPFSL